MVSYKIPSNGGWIWINAPSDSRLLCWDGTLCRHRQIEYPDDKVCAVISPSFINFGSVRVFYCDASFFDDFCFMEKDGRVYCDLSFLEVE